MPEIIIGLQFEAELVDYFEVTYAWHAYPGEMSTRPGFRTLELHHLLFEHILPFWEGAKKDPKGRFPLTYALVDAMTNEEKKVKKLDQLNLGINAGYNEIGKLYQTLLKAPMIYLATLDPANGPSIFRAILAVVELESKGIIDSAHTQYDDGQEYNTIVDTDPFDSEWGEFKYEGEDRPEEEQIWYDWLLPNRASLVHWYQQLGLCRKVVLHDLKKLSREGQDEPQHRKSESSTKLHDFFVQYPVLFTAYRAVFALLPSASRIVESAHGIIRYSYNPQVPQQFLNDTMRYKMGIGHDMNESRRKRVRKEMAEKDMEGGAPTRKRRKVKHHDRNMTVHMSGLQIMKLLKRYSATVLDVLPPLIKSKTKIKTINEALSRRIEASLKRKKEDLAEEVREMRKNTRVEKSSEEFHDIAESTLTEHDAAWSLRGERDEMVIIREILTKRWWSSVPVDSFHDELVRVIPTFQPLGLQGEIKTKILKKGNKIDL
ncbi:hypothetical protein ACHAXR_001468, partial [Thalassiosira sp. AJA248-18]